MLSDQRIVALNQEFSNSASNLILSFIDGRGRSYSGGSNGAVFSSGLYQVIIYGSAGQRSSNVTPTNVHRTRNFGNFEGFSIPIGTRKSPLRNVEYVTKDDSGSYKYESGKYLHLVDSRNTSVAQVGTKKLFINLDLADTEDSVAIVRHLVKKYVIGETSGTYPACFRDAVSTTNFSSESLVDGGIVDIPPPVVKTWGERRDPLALGSVLEGSARSDRLRGVIESKALPNIPEVLRSSKIPLESARSRYNSALTSLREAKNALKLEEEKYESVCRQLLKPKENFNSQISASFEALVSVLDTMYEKSWESSDYITFLTKPITMCDTDLGLKADVGRFRVLIKKMNLMPKYYRDDGRAAVREEFYENISSADTYYPSPHCFMSSLGDNSPSICWGSVLSDTLKSLAEEGKLAEILMMVHEHLVNSNSEDCYLNFIEYCKSLNIETRPLNGPEVSSEEPSREERTILQGEVVNVDLSQIVEV